MREWPIHATIDGPIVMIGFGSIGRGTLPLILRHFDFDRSRMVVIDPDDRGSRALRRSRASASSTSRSRAKTIAISSRRF